MTARLFMTRMPRFLSMFSLPGYDPRSSMPNPKEILRDPLYYIHHPGERLRPLVHNLAVRDFKGKIEQGLITGPLLYHNPYYHKPISYENTEYEIMRHIVEDVMDNQDNIDKEMRQYFEQMGLHQA